MIKAPMKQIVTLADFDLPGVPRRIVEEAANKAAWAMAWNDVVPQVGSAILFDVNGQTVYAVVQAVYHDATGGRGGYIGALIHLSNIQWYT